MAPNLDRETARALVDAGYMPLHRYVELYGSSNLAMDNGPADAVSRDRSDWRRPPQAARSTAPGGRSHRRKHKTHKAA